MHWLNTSAPAAGTEEIIRHIKQHCEKGGQREVEVEREYLLFCSSANLFMLLKHTSPHSVGEFSKRQRVYGRQPGEGGGGQAGNANDTLSSIVGLNLTEKWIFCICYVKHLGHLGSLLYEI